eukprot:3384210-Pyramimonas_sp.AAC.1
MLASGARFSRRARTTRCRGSTTNRTSRSACVPRVFRVFLAPERLLRPVTDLLAPRSSLL